MDNAEFWELIEAARVASPGDQQQQQKAALISRLAQLEPEQIIGFECRLREYLRAADHFNIMAALKIIDGHVSDDSYLYFRCWLIGQGEAVFTTALQNPDSLAAVMDEPYQEFEELLYVATAAFGKRTGETEENDTFPRAVAATRGLSYDFGAETQGEDWTESQLPKLLPKLWKKFGVA